VTRHSVLQALGCIIIAVGAGMLAPWLGVLAFGTCALLLGLVLEVRDNGER
jgi:hypothetical protein